MAEDNANIMSSKVTSLNISNDSCEDSTLRPTVTDKSSPVVFVVAAIALFAVVVIIIIFYFSCKQQKQKRMSTGEFLLRL
ncbi:hypothetical protein HOLleu_44657 [Holothuria leucospilota]|uniref:Uncharacterized protein n=1 Tax=Holothuria leucospilota TaxID=206669 RepID=A0A9Q0Y8P1_HOLLE|nr:hypothetical protein HOLleu_44657 [Holothuria leucospilota]